MDVGWLEDGSVYNQIQHQHNKIPTRPPCHSILPVVCIQRRDVDNTAAAQEHHTIVYPRATKAPNIKHANNIDN